MHLLQYLSKTIPRCVRDVRIGDQGFCYGETTSTGEVLVSHLHQVLEVLARGDTHFPVEITVLAHRDETSKE